MEDIIQKVQGKISELLESPPELPTYVKWLLAGGTLATTWTFIYWLRIGYTRWQRSSPPGLFGIPFFGSFFTMSYYGSTNFYTKLLPQYGGITSHYIGKQEFITIHDKNLIETIFSHDCSINRPSNQREIYVGTILQPSLIAVNDDKNKQLWLRRRNMVEFAINKLCENSTFVDNEIIKLLNARLFGKLNKISKFSKNNNKNNKNKSKNNKTNSKNGIWHVRYDIKNLFNRLSWNMIFGDKYTFKSDDISYNDELLQNINKKIEGVFESATIAFIAGMFPSIGIEQLFLYSQNQKFKRLCNESGSFVQNKINGAITLKGIGGVSNKDKSELITYFDELYDAFKNDIKTKDSYLGKMTQDMFVADIWLFVLHSTQSLSAHCESCIAHLAQYPTMQEQIYNEIKATVNEKTRTDNNNENNNNNNNNNIYFDSKEVAKCPLFRAFVNEVIRLLVFFPRCLSHQLTKTCKLSYNRLPDGTCTDIEFRPISQRYNQNESEMIAEATDTNKQYAYILREDTPIDANMYYVATSDKTLWPENVNPKQINLNNWLKKDEFGEIKFVNNSNSMAFGFGKRMCIGKEFAMKQLYSFVGNILLRYKLNAINKNEEIDYYEGVSRAVLPNKLKVFVETR